MFGELARGVVLEKTIGTHDWRRRLENRFGSVFGELDRGIVLENKTIETHDWRGQLESRFGNVFGERH